MKRSLDSSIGIGMGCALDGWGSIPGSGKEFFSSSQNPDRYWGPPNLLSKGYWWLFPPRLKRLGHEADHSTQSGAEVKNSGAIPSLLQMYSWGYVN
jgi:hypothetical protein